MGLALVRIGIGAAFLMAASVAAADDPGDAGDLSMDDDAGSSGAVRDAAILADGPTIACDGALCDTQTGTTCDVGGMSPGRFSPSSASGFGVLGLLGLAAGARRRARRQPPDGQCGTSRPASTRSAG